MTALPHLFLADSLRAITIGLWGLLLGQSFWALWYATKLRGIYRRLDLKPDRYRMLWRHILLVTLVFDSMATEISWKIIFNGVGKVGIAMWTYPNLAIYGLSNVALYLVVQMERRRYVRARLYEVQRQIEPGDEE